jgi:hypothetical protein
MQIKAKKNAPLIFFSRPASHRVPSFFRMEASSVIIVISI